VRKPCAHRLDEVRRPATPADAVAVDPPGGHTTNLERDGNADLTDFARPANTRGAAGGGAQTWDAENQPVPAGKAAARKLTRARIPLQADESDEGCGWTDERIVEGVGFAAR